MFSIKKYVYRTACLTFAIAVFSGLPAVAASNPFDDACKLAEQSATAWETGATQSCYTGGTTELKYIRNFNGDTTAVDKVLAKLTQKYGIQKSTRGNSYVWEVDNPTKGLKQADLVTIILTVDPNGLSVLIIDRAREGSSIASDTIEKNSVSKPKKKQKSRPPSKEQG